ncbi:MAG TPA: Holliday junction resolvase RuvX [Gammaproteobacteria bacterium]|nr:Holliday junction resolvase RuvX [Gammaproteobacteria bacterium]
MPEARGITLLAFDFGLRRIGVAVGQSLTGSASPVGVVPARDGAPEWPVLQRYLRDWAPDQLVVGLPYTMDGGEQEITRRARQFAAALGRHFTGPIHTIDERLSSREAEMRLKALRQEGRRRISRDDIDCAAACVILESWLNAHNNSNNTVDS